LFTTGGKEEGGKRRKERSLLAGQNKMPLIFLHRKKEGGSGKVGEGAKDGFSDIERGGGRKKGISNRGWERRGMRRGKKGIDRSSGTGERRRKKRQNSSL